MRVGILGRLSLRSKLFLGPALGVLCFGVMAATTYYGLSQQQRTIGQISDVRFDPETGTIESFVLDEREQSPASLLGAGSYAAIFGSQ